MKPHRCIILLFICRLISPSFKPSDPSAYSALVFKMTYNSKGQFGFGGHLKIRNTETNELFESSSKPSFNSLITIENVPAGRYKVEEVKIPFGQWQLILKDTSMFNTIQVNDAKIYYLGSYMGRQLPPIMKMGQFQIIKAENEEDEKIYKRLRKKSEKWQALKIEYEKKLFKTDTTVINAR